MNTEQLISFVRQILLFLGGILVGKGYIDTETMTALVGAVLTIGASGWALYTRRKAGLIASAAAVPEVGKIVTTPDLAIAVPSPKVVPPPREPITPQRA